MKKRNYVSRRKSTTDKKPIKLLQQLKPKKKPSKRKQESKKKLMKKLKLKRLPLKNKMSMLRSKLINRLMLLTEKDPMRAMKLILPKQRKQVMKRTREKTDFLNKTPRKRTKKIRRNDYDCQPIFYFKLISIKIYYFIAF